MLVRELFFNDLSLCDHTDCDTSAGGGGVDAAEAEGGERAALTGCFRAVFGT